MSFKITILHIILKDRTVYCSENVLTNALDAFQMCRQMDVIKTSKCKYSDEIQQNVVQLKKGLRSVTRRARQDFSTCFRI